MRKRYIASAAGATGAGIAGYFLKDAGNRSKLKEKAIYVTDKIKNKSNSNSNFEDAGIPDQSENQDHAQLEKSKMVSEGSPVWSRVL